MANSDQFWLVEILILLNESDWSFSFKDFEEMRTVFENIAMAITEKSQNPTPESEGNIKSAIKKALRMVSECPCFWLVEFDYWPIRGGYLKLKKGNSKI